MFWAFWRRISTINRIGGCVYDTAHGRIGTHPAAHGSAERPETSPVFLQVLIESADPSLCVTDHEKGA